MTEEEARDWVSKRFGATAEAQLARFADLLVIASATQNLVAASTHATVWSRHIADSAQLVPLAAAVPGLWIDVGSGAGLPGLVAAMLSGRQTTLIEPRPRRAGFLRDAITALNLSDRVTVVVERVERFSAAAAVISARAVAPLDRLLTASVHCSTIDTLWLLPKGRTARNEVESLGGAWHGLFHVERSLTDPDSLIIVAKGVARA